jgi:dTDP-glucose pyrophosphorylase
MSSELKPMGLLTIVIPMAGRGSRFSAVGYRDPKPLIPVGRSPMIKVVIDNLTPSRPHRFVFICQAEHVEAYGLRERLEAWAPGCAVVEIDGVTEGAACTVLMARDLIGDDPIMIANSDQYIDIAIDDYLAVQDQGFDGLIMTMRADDPKWSFVGLDETGKRVTRVVEKEVISDEATVGIYNFASGSDFVRAADEMIAADRRVNGEFYVAPVYNELIAEGQQVTIFNIGAEADGMYGLGTPADLDLFLAHDVSAPLRAPQ